MSWFAWFMLGVLAGLALLGMVLAAVGRESEERRAETSAEASASNIRESFAGSNDALGERLRDGAA